MKRKPYLSEVYCEDLMEFIYTNHEKIAKAFLKLQKGKLLARFQTDTRYDKIFYYERKTYYSYTVDFLLNSFMTEVPSLSFIIYGFYMIGTSVIKGLIIVLLITALQISIAKFQLFFWKNHKKKQDNLNFQQYSHKKYFVLNILIC